MACIGIDIGFANAVVAIARRGGIDVLDNEVSKKLTACMVGFSGKERKLGEQALNGITSNMKNTVTGVKAIIGKKFHSEEIQNEIPRVAYSMVDVAGSVGIPVRYNDDELVLTPEKCMSMLLRCMQKIAAREHAAGVEVKDVVLSVPAYFTDAERRAMLDAASIVGLNVLRLITDVTAAALAYGIYKTDLPPDRTTTVVFVDMGALDTTCSVVALVKGKLTVLSTASDRHLGGRDFDEVLARHFAAEWKEKHKIDATTNKKAWFRLMTAAEKTKKVLSANPKAPIAIESFMEDIDVRGMMERTDYLAMCEPLMEKLKKVLTDAFEASGLTKQDVHSVEILGGSVRIPTVQATIEEYFGKPCMKTQNFDECVAKGCALQCAMLSPAFKVRDFSVNDVTMYPIALSWSPTAGAADNMEVDTDPDAAQPKPGASNTVVFSRFNPVPNTKMLTFYRKETFTLTAAYDASVPLPVGFSPKLNEFTISDVPARVGADGKPEASKIKVKLRLDLHGCLQLESAQAIEEHEVIEELPPTPTPPETPAPAPAPAAEGAAEADAGAPAAAAGGDATMPEAAPADSKPEEAAAGVEVEVEKKKTKKVKRVNLTVGERGGGMNAQEMMDAMEAEGKMAIQDRIIQETADAMNNLESRIYAMRDDLSTRYAAFVPEADKATLSALLTSLEDWLYEDGADADKPMYEAKLAELMQACAPAVTREREAGLRGDAAAALEAGVARYLELGASEEEMYAHIDKEDKAKVTAEAEAARAWLAEMQAKLVGHEPTADPPFLAAELTAKLDALKAVCDPIMAKPKPPPPSPPAAVEPETPPAEGAEAEAGTEADEAKEPPKPDNMDVD